MHRDRRKKRRKKLSNYIKPFIFANHTSLFRLSVSHNLWNYRTLASSSSSFLSFFLFFFEKSIKYKPRFKWILSESSSSSKNIEPEFSSPIAFYLLPFPLLPSLAVSRPRPRHRRSIVLNIFFYALGNVYIEEVRRGLFIKKSLRKSQGVQHRHHSRSMCAWNYFTIPGVLSDRYIKCRKEWKERKKKSFTRQKRSQMS